MEYTANYKDITSYSVFGNTNELSAAFFSYLTDLVTVAYSENKPFNIALSGGSTPMAIYRYMSLVQKGFNKWENFHIYWGDERCVEPEDAESNFGNAWRTLLEKSEIPHDNIHRIMGEKDPAEEAVRYAEVLRQMDAGRVIPNFDLIVLGLGEDGHTASIFPDRMELLDTKDLTAVAEHPVSKQLRITLTGEVLNNAKNILFLATGIKKAEIVKHIFMDSKEAVNYPAYHIRPNRGRLSWLLDNDSSSLLPFHK